MNREERSNLFRLAFDTLKAHKSIVEGCFVIFENPITEKFVQFAYSSQDQMFVMDIPLAELSVYEETRIRSILGEEGAVDVETGEQVSYQELFQVDEVERAIELTEKIFANVFNLPECYKLEIDLKLR